MHRTELLGCDVREPVKSPLGAALYVAVVCGVIGASPAPHSRRTILEGPLGLTHTKFLSLLAVACCALVGCLRASQGGARPTPSPESSASQDSHHEALTIYVADPLAGPLDDLVSAGLRAHPTPEVVAIMEAYGPRGGMHWKSWVRSAAGGPAVPARSLVIVSTDGFPGPDDFPAYVGSQGLSLEKGTFKLRARDCTYYVVSKPGTATDALDAWKRWLEEPPLK